MHLLFVRKSYLNSECPAGARARVVDPFKINVAFGCRNNVDI